MVQEKEPPVPLNENNFHKEVLDNSKPVLVVFGADWSGACHIITPMIEELNAEFKGQIMVGNLDIDTSKSVAQEYGIRDIPTLLFFKKGKVVDQITGTVPKTIIAVKIIALL